MFPGRGRSAEKSLRQEQAYVWSNWKDRTSEKRGQRERGPLVTAACDSVPPPVTGQLILQNLLKLPHLLYGLFIRV